MIVGPTIFCCVAMVGGLPSVEADAIGRDLSRVWHDGSPARRLRVGCQFELAIEQPDVALGDRYFPNFTSVEGDGPRARVRTGNRTKWLEDIATSGARYRDSVEFTPPGGRVDRRYNGTNSWRFDPLRKSATQYLGPDPTTRPNLGYYGDMIGFPTAGLGKGRTIADDSGEPYRLDLLVPSGQYRVNGEATVDGLACVVLTRPGLDKLWLARDRGWAIVRREWNWSVDGPLKRRIDNRDFREVAPGAWVPHQGAMEIYGHPTTRPGRRVAVLHASVRQAEADVPDSWFEPDFPRGTSVVDGETGDRFPFGVELSMLDPSDPSVRASHFGPAFRAEAWWSRPRAWGPAAAMVVALAAWYARFRVARQER